MWTPLASGQGGRPPHGEPWPCNSRDDHVNLSEAKDVFTMSLELVPTATAAFIAGLSDRQMQRVVDEEIIGSPLVRREGVRGFAVMTTALAKFTSPPMTR